MSHSSSHSENLINGVLSLFAGIPAYFAAIDPQTISVLSALVLPCVFFAIGKTADLLFRWYVEKRNNK